MQLWQTASMRARPVVLVLIMLCGCQDGEKPAGDRAPAGARTTGPYNQEERALYREAVRRLEDFEARNSHFLAAGQANRRARQFYRSQLRDWQSSFSLLGWFETNGIRVQHGPTILATEAASIESFQDNAAEIVLRRCADQSTTRATRDGLLIPIPHEGPVVQNVVVYRYENSTWSIGKIETTDEPCEG